MGLAWAVYRGTDELTLACIEFSEGGFGVSTRTLFQASPLLGAPRITLQALNRRVVVALGENLRILGGSRTVELDLPQPILRLRAGPAGSQVAAACEEGAALIWLRERTVESNPFAADMQAPHVALAGDGRLLALTRFEGRVYSTRGYGLEHLSTFPGPGHDVVALMNAGPDELAILSPNGRVRLFRLPSE